MPTLRYAINVTLDGCCDHRAVAPDEALHQFHTRNMEEARGMLCGRVIYQMMEEAWRAPGETGVLADWMEPWMLDFARAIHETPKYVVSRTLEQVDWNAELLSGDLATAVRALKEAPGDGVLLVGGVTLPRALAELDLIDAYEFVVHPRVAGHGPTLLAGLPTPLALRLQERVEFDSGVVVLRYGRA